MLLIWSFQLNVGCSRVELPALNAACMGLKLLTWGSASLTAVISTLVAVINPCIMAFVMLCSAAILSVF